MATETVSLSRLLSTCLYVSRKAGAVIRDVRQNGLMDTYTDKNSSGNANDWDPQTVADIKSQQLIIDTLKSVYPNLTICGEEDAKSMEKLFETVPKCTVVPPNETLFDAYFSSSDPLYKIPDYLRNIPTSSLIVWVDPLDGTREFVKGPLDAVTTLIGISCEGMPLAGVIHSPFTGATYVGGVGIGLFSNQPLVTVDEYAHLLYTPEIHQKLTTIYSSHVDIDKQNSQDNQDNQTNDTKGKTNIEMNLDTASQPFIFEDEIFRRAYSKQFIQKVQTQQEQQKQQKDTTNDTDEGDERDNTNERDRTNRKDEIVPITMEIPAGRVIVTTNTRQSQTLLDKLQLLKPTEIKGVGGAGNKAIQLLTGKANAFVYPQTGTKYWDTCAVHAILHSVGGEVTNMYGHPIIYNLPIRKFVALNPQCKVARKNKVNTTSSQSSRMNEKVISKMSDEYNSRIADIEDESDDQYFIPGFVPLDEDTIEDVTNTHGISLTIEGDSENHKSFTFPHSKV